jgi:lipase maturation factor 1
MDWQPASFIRRWFDPEYGAADRLLPRWIFLRALGLIYFSAFFSLVFQIRGLIGAQGILPSNEYLEAVARQFGLARFWFAPTLLWFSTGPHMLSAICWVGMIASLLVVFNVWPRAMLFICLVCFLSFVSAAQDFSGYQSDGMLLEAGFISLFFVPPGFLPGLGRAHPPSRASLFLLQWEWFRIYFESGMVKVFSGDPEWRNFTAMDEYYQNGPLPTWIGWYVQHLPHGFHAFATGATLVLELGLVFMLFLPRRWRIACFFIVTAWQIPVILTANYTFLNYLVLVLGFLLLDDPFLLRIMPEKWRAYIGPRIAPRAQTDVKLPDAPSDSPPAKQKSLRPLQALRLSLVSVMLIWIFYSTTVQMIWIVWRVPLPTSPIAALDPFRIANRYGLFAVMTRGRYEIEFQGSNDGQNWTAYPFRYKPQGPSRPPGIYAPYQPRFDWNLWFASLGGWRDNLIVPSTEERLLAGSPDVLALFAGNPFPQSPPQQVRAVLWQYWFTTFPEKRSTGMWWRRQLLGLYAPVLERLPDGKVGVVQWPEPLLPRQ